jgi:hypothetical protein
VENLGQCRIPHAFGRCYRGNRDDAMQRRASATPSWLGATTTQSWPRSRRCRRPITARIGLIGEAQGSTAPVKPGHQLVQSCRLVGDLPHRPDLAIPAGLRHTDGDCRLVQGPARQN